MISKINQALLQWKDGAVHTQVYFDRLGLDFRRVHEYKKKGLLRALGGGGYLRSNDAFNWIAAVSALQNERKLPVHISGLTALNLQGVRVNLPMGSGAPVYLMSSKTVHLPVWITRHNWGVRFVLKRSNLLDGRGIIHFDQEQYPIQISCRERAILELIDQLDLQHSFETLENYMESSRTLRSEVLQKLLEQCRSIKVKRVFLYVSEKLDLPFFQKLDIEKINLGKGKRVVTRDGQLDLKYGITVPKELKENPF